MCCDCHALQCGAVRGSAVQCVAVCCRVLQRVSVRCGALQCIAVRYRALQCVAVRCSALQCVTVRCSALQCVAVRCSALQCVAVRCSALQFTAERCVPLIRLYTTHCNPLQFAATYRNTQIYFCHSAPVIRNILSPNQVMNTSFGSWRFVSEALYTLKRTSMNTSCPSYERVMKMVNLEIVCHSI